MTIKERLFFSNILMLIIPVLVSIFMIFVSMYLFSNVFYKQYIGEAAYESDIEEMQNIITGESIGLIKGGYDEEDILSFYEKIDSYINLKTVKVEIYGEKEIVFSTSRENVSGNDSVLYDMLKSIGGTGNVSANGTNLYGKNISVSGKQYTLCIYTRQTVPTGRKNEITLRNIIFILCILIIVSVLITNRFLTKFVFKKIKEPLNKLYNGVHKISEGNLDYRIEYKGKDEFKQICDDFNEMAEHLKASVDLAQKEYNSRKELIAGISHDLRTPLTSIKAYIEGLLEGVASTPEMQKKYMETILVKADDIDKMVDKLFLFSKLDLGDYPFYPEEINVKYEIEKFINQNKREYDLRGMNIEAEDIPEELRVYTDPVQLGNALTNIVENSLKYKNGERVNVKIYCKDGEKYTDIIIDDDGPGVAEEETGKLFDVFYRGDPSRSNPNKGSGLGLAITAKISEGQGGFVKAENIKPKGLRIIMTIPKERIK